MFNHPLFLPIALGVIVLGVFYLIVSGRSAAPSHDAEVDKGSHHYHVQCPKCQRWKRLQPIRREKLLDEQEARQRRLLPGPRPRFLHEYKCAFCGHIWQENYSE